MWDVIFWLSAPTIVIGTTIYFLTRKFGKPIPETAEEKAYWQAIK